MAAVTTNDDIPVGQQQQQQLDQEQTCILIATRLPIDLVLIVAEYSLTCDMHFVGSAASGCVSGCLPALARALGERWRRGDVPPPPGDNVGYDPEPLRHESCCQAAPAKVVQPPRPDRPLVLGQFAPHCRRRWLPDFFTLSVLGGPDVGKTSVIWAWQQTTESARQVAYRGLPPGAAAGFTATADAKWPHMPTHLRSYSKPVALDLRFHPVGCSFKVCGTERQERFRAVPRSQWRNCSALILVYSSLDNRSLTEARYWLWRVRQDQPGVLSLLLETKADQLLAHRQTCLRCEEYDITKRLNAL